MKTIQEKFNAYKSGKLDSHNFLREIRRSYPNLVNNSTPLSHAITKLKQRGIVTEEAPAIVSVPSVNQMISNFQDFLNEGKKADTSDPKAVIKKQSPQVNSHMTKIFNPAESSPDNLNPDSVLDGIDFELEKKPSLTLDQAQVKAIKNLRKDPLYYMRKKWGVQDYDPMKSSDEDQMKPLKEGKLNLQTLLRDQMVVEGYKVDLGDEIIKADTSEELANKMTEWYGYELRGLTVLNETIPALTNKPIFEGLQGPFYNSGIIYYSK